MFVNAEKLAKLNPGMLFQNYKAVCDFLGESVATGSSPKESQLAIWRKYFDWEMEGHRWLITKVYDEPQKSRREPIVADPAARNYKKYISYALLLQLYDACGSGQLEGNRLVMTWEQLAKTCALVNRHFSWKVKQDTSVSYDNREAFLSRINAENKKILSDVIADLALAHHFSHTLGFRAVKEGVEVLLLGNAVVPVNEAIRDTLRSFKAKSSRDVFVRKLGSRFFDKLKETLMERQGISFHQPVIAFYLSERTLLKSITEMELENGELTQYLEAINKLAELKDEVRVKTQIRYVGGKTAASSRWVVDTTNKVEALPEGFLEAQELLRKRYLQIKAEQKLETGGSND